jgi:hypothetical protein
VLSPSSQNKMRREIGRWYCPYFCIDRTVFMPGVHGLFSIQLVLKIDQSEENLLPHT